MGLQDFGCHALSCGQLCSLICHAERWLPNKGENDFSLVPFVDILENLFPMSNLSGRQRMNIVSQIGYCGFAHLLLM